MRMRLQSTNGCCHHFHTALSAHLTISRSHATALFVYSESDYASAVIGQHLVHMDGVDDVKMHGTSPDPRASFCIILTVHVCGTSYDMDYRGMTTRHTRTIKPFPKVHKTRGGSSASAYVVTSSAFKHSCCRSLHSHPLEE